MDSDIIIVVCRSEHFFSLASSILPRDAYLDLRKLFFADRKLRHRVFIRTHWGLKNELKP